MGRRIGLAVLCMTLFSFAANPGTGEDEVDPPEEATETSVMEQKLEHAQGVLSALAREDFEGLRTNADALLRLSEEQWISRETPEYRAQLKDFWVVLEGVKSGADEENLDGATLAYMQMTLSCVRCHKYLRTNAE